MGYGRRVPAYLGMRHVLAVGYQQCSRLWRAVLFGTAENNGGTWTLVTGCEPFGSITELTDAQLANIGVREAACYGAGQTVFVSWLFVSSVWVSLTSRDGTNTVVFILQLIAILQCNIVLILDLQLIAVLLGN
jgi:hypothetical protein